MAQWCGNCGHKVRGTGDWNARHVAVVGLTFKEVTLRLDHDPFVIVSGPWWRRWWQRADRIAYEARRLVDQ